MEIYTEHNLTEDMKKELSDGRGNEPGTKTRAMTSLNATYSDSTLVNYTCISPNCNSPRNHSIDTITIHMVWGQCTVEALGAIFAPSSRQASSNYGIGFDGKVGLYCHERDRSWCSSSASNDNRAITIETASDTFYPYAVTDKAYNMLIKLCADICKRNGKTKMVWCGSLQATNNRVFEPWEMRMTLHKWFADTACPGYYLESRMAKIADSVNSLLAPIVYPKAPFAVKVLIDDLNLRKGAGTNTAVKGYVAKGNHIIDEVKNDFGYIKKLKGWIYLAEPKYTKIGAHIEMSPYKDIDTNDPDYTAIKAVYEAGLMKGSNGKFKPKGKVTRRQMAIILYRILKLINKK